MPSKCRKPEFQDRLSSSGITKSPRRRAPSHACTRCRQRKSKCDGDRPSCSTCSLVYQTKCFYDQDQYSGATETSKLQLDVPPPIMRPSVSPMSNFVEPSRVEDIFQPFNDPRVAVMIEPRLRPSIDITSNSDNFGSDMLSEPASLSTSDVLLPQVLGQESFELELFTHRMHLAPGAPGPKVLSKPFNPSNGRSSTTVSGVTGRITPPDIRRWFRRAYDPEFLVHLLDLYFCWIHPSYQIFSWNHFLHDFQSGQSNHCSRILANAIAAFACSYSDRMAALADPNDPSTAGDQFFTEAERLFQHGSESPPTLALALSIMSSRELACGRTFTSLYYAETCQSLGYQHGPTSIPSTTGLKITNDFSQSMVV